MEKLQQSYIFIPSKYKVSRSIFLTGTISLSLSLSPLQDCYLVSILNEFAGNSFMVFCSTCANTQR